MGIYTDQTKMPFGKHKGMKLIDVPASYLEWLYYNVDLRTKDYKLFRYIEDNWEEIQLEIGE